MTRPRISLGVMCLAVVYLALGLLALRESDALWMSVVMTVTFLGLLTATLQAIAASGGSRRFWVGFVVFGWAFFLAMAYPGASQTLGSMLASTHLINLISAMLRPEVPGRTPGASIIQYTGLGFQYTGLGFNPTSPERFAFLHIAHCYVTALMALLGGWAAVQLAKHQAPPTPDAGKPSAIPGPDRPENGSGLR
jgi:hypothetical protein